jgi:hypothetical protein
LIRHGANSYAEKQLSARGVTVRFFFSKITSQDDARKTIRSAAAAFFLLAALQIAVAVMVVIYGASSQAAKYARLPPDAALNYFGTAAGIMILTSFLRGFNSRIAAMLLVLVYVAIVANTIINSGTQPHPGNVGLAILAILIALRAVYATFKFQRYLDASERPTAPDPAPRDPESPPPKSKRYDVDKWEALVKYDDDIAMVAEKLRPLGEKWVDEFARSYLLLNDKKYLLSIVQKIIKAAKDEAATAQA